MEGVDSGMMIDSEVDGWIVDEEEWAGVTAGGGGWVDREAVDGTVENVAGAVGGEEMEIWNSKVKLNNL